jgi:hypothetical protein
MGTWTENWKATHSSYVKANKEVKNVVEHRRVEKGEIYCVAIENGGFEVRHYEGEKLKAKTAYPSGVKAVLAYRELRDKLVPGRVAPKPKVTAKVEVAPKKATKKATKKKATKKKATKRKVAKKATKRKVAKKATKKKATKKATKKKATKKKVAKKVKPKVKRKPNPAFMAPMMPDAVLGAVVGDKPMPRTEITKRLWDYIKKHNLQDRINRRMINADEALRRVFGKGTVSMFEMNKLLQAHLKKA